MKNIQFKTTAIFCSAGIIFFTIMNFINNIMYKKLNNDASVEVINKEITMSWILWLVLVILFVVLSIVLVNVILKYVGKSLSSIVDNVSKYEEDDENSIKYLSDGKEDNFSKKINKKIKLKQFYYT